MKLVQEAVDGDPTNEGLLSILAECEANVANLRAKSGVDEIPPPPPPPATEELNPPPPPKWDPKKHPAFQKSSEPVEEASKAPETQKGDYVMGKWSDGGHYKAKVLDITGSSKNPMYLVKWSGFKETSNLSAREIKPFNIDSKKRKADGPPVTSSNPIPTPNSGVISAPANINADAVKQARHEPSKVGDGPERPPPIPKKLKNKKDYENKKDGWKNFRASKSGKKTAGESMFRLSSDVNSRGTSSSSSLLSINWRSANISSL